MRFLGFSQKDKGEGTHSTQEESGLESAGMGCKSFKPHEGMIDMACGSRATCCALSRECHWAGHERFYHKERVIVHHVETQHHRVDEYALCIDNVGGQLWLASRCCFTVL